MSERALADLDRWRDGLKAVSCDAPAGHGLQDRAGPMTAHLKASLQFLRLNRNASAHTVRAYESDLSQFLAHAAAGASVKASELRPGALDRNAIRQFVGALHKHGQSRATAARKLAAVRTFLRYLRREALIDDDPGTLVATPKREVRMPAHLSEEEMAALIAAAADDTPLGRAGLCDSRDLLCVGASAQRSGRTRSRRRQSGRQDGAGTGQGRQATPRSVQYQHGESAARVSERSSRSARRKGGKGRTQAAGTERRPSGLSRLREPLFVNYRGGRLTVRSIDRLVRRYVARSSARDRHQSPRAAPFLRDAPAAARR